MFRPDAEGFPRWDGNMKQYKLAKVGTELRTVDAYDYPDTINPLTGFVDRCARSYWTPTRWTRIGRSSRRGVHDHTRDRPTPAESLTDPEQRLTATSSKKVLRPTRCAAVTTDESGPVRRPAPRGRPDRFRHHDRQAGPRGACDDTAGRDKLISWAKGLDVDDEDLDGYERACVRRRTATSSIPARSRSISAD